MTHSYGFRSGTRCKFAKGFRAHGMPAPSKYLDVFKAGDYVTLKVDSAIQKGMPHQYYHGRTGVVYSVSKRAIGVAFAKRVRQKEVIKRMHVRMEHVHKSRCREEFINRMKENARLRKEHKEAGNTEPLDLKRKPEGPKPARSFVDGKNLQMLAPLPFEEHY